MALLMGDPRKVLVADRCSMAPQLRQSSSHHVVKGIANQWLINLYHLRDFPLVILVRAGNISIGHRPRGLREEAAVKGSDIVWAFVVFSSCVCVGSRAQSSCILNRTLSSALPAVGTR